MSVIVGAYPAQPQDQQQEFYRQLGGIAAIRGLELPYGPAGGIPWPAGAPDSWSMVVTAIPGTMKRLAADPSFGLASENAQGRREALTFVAGLRNDVAALTEGGRVVEAVELHSAPSLHSSASSLEESLREILDWDWGNTSVLIEHCDAPRQDSKPEKGFLTFDEELDVVRSLRGRGFGRVGVLVNWARSVIESRQTKTPVDQLSQARAAGVLGGVMFSGCSAEATEFGYPWIDAHLPAVEVEGAPASSLLNRHEIQRCLAAAGPVPVTGFKIGLPAHGLSPQERADRLSRMCDLTM
jgi:Domain of unknown function (DUF4862)